MKIRISKENSMHAPFQRNTFLLFTFGTIEQGHVKKVYDLSVRVDSDYLLNFKPLDLNTSLTSCFFFSMCLGVALHTEVWYRHHSTAPLYLDLWIWVLSVSACTNRNHFPNQVLWGSCLLVLFFTFASFKILLASW